MPRATGQNKAATIATEKRETMQFALRSLFDELELLHLILTQARRRAPGYLDDLLENGQERAETITELVRIIQKG